MGSRRCEIAAPRQSLRRERAAPRMSDAQRLTPVPWHPHGIEQRGQASECESWQVLAPLFVVNPPCITPETSQCSAVSLAARSALASLLSTPVSVCHRIEWHRVVSWKLRHCARQRIVCCAWLHLYPPAGGLEHPAAPTDAPIRERGPREPQPRGAFDRGHRPVDQVEAAERFIAATEREKAHDERLWDIRLRRDAAAHSLPEWSACLSRPRRGHLHRLIGGLTPFRLVARLQRTRDRSSDIAADERFAEHVDDPCGLRAFAQWRTTVAAHEDD
jgi:hypothetical protein